MSGWIRNLFVLLVVQLVLLAFLQFSGEPERSAKAALLELEPAAVSGLSVSDSDGNEVDLEQKDGKWLLASGLPANTDKVTELLEKLTETSLSWPVSTSASAHERFEVAQDKYQRRLVLTGGDDATLFFGTSPGYQQVHARGTTDSVYAVKLATYEMPAKADDWLDKSLLQPVGDITAILWEDSVALKKAPEGWMLGSEPAGADSAQGAVDRVTDLQVLGVLESAPTAAPSDAREILVTDTDGEYRISYWPRESNNDHVLMSTRFPGEAFRMSNYVAEQLTPSATELKPPAAVPADEEIPGMPQVDLSDVLPTDPAS